jgi:hypothetical protein
MTGAELAIAGKYVAPWAGKASLALRNRITYRRSIDGVCTRPVSSHTHDTLSVSGSRPFLKRT